MKIQEHIPLLEEIFSSWQHIIGSEYQGYRNNVYRMINFCLFLRQCTEEEQEKIIIAGAFHNIGIWIEDTVDYIPPSLPPAMEYLKNRNLEAWSEDIGLMISEHHKIQEYRDETYPLVEIFRRGDLVDFSFGMINFGIPEMYITELPGSKKRNTLGIWSFQVFYQLSCLGTNQGYSQ